MSQVDHAGHDFGLACQWSVCWASLVYRPDTPQVANAVQAADTIIGTLVRCCWSCAFTSSTRASGLSARGLLGQVDLVVVSDHGLGALVAFVLIGCSCSGMTAISPSRAVYLDDYVDMSLFRVVDWSPVTSILPKAGQEQIVYNALHGSPFVCCQ